MWWWVLDWAGLHARGRNGVLKRENKKKRGGLGLWYEKRRKGKKKELRFEEIEEE